MGIDLDRRALVARPSSLTRGLRFARSPSPGGAYNALSDIHTDHLRDLLEDARIQREQREQRQAREGGAATAPAGAVRLKDLTKALRDDREAFGAPEGAAKGGTIELLLQSLAGKRADDQTLTKTKESLDDGVGTLASAAAFSTARIVAALAAVSRRI